MARDADNFDTGSSRAERASSTNLVLPDMPSDQPLRHEGALWDKKSVEALRRTDLLSVARGGEPTECMLLEDYDLEDYPMLDAGHRDFERRMETRNKLMRINRSNAKDRYVKKLKAWDVIYAACRECCLANAPMLYEGIEAKCSLDDRVTADDPAFGRYDGPRAFQILQYVCTGGDRTDADKKFYRVAEAAQLAHPLKDGCSADEYSRRALAFMFKINPFLAQKLKYDAVDSADYLIKLMPPMLKEAGRRTRDNLKSAGQLTNLMAVAAACRALVLEEQSVKGVGQALLGSNSHFDLGGADLAQLAEVCGIAACRPARIDDSTGKLRSGALAAAGGDLSKVMWCSGCPHKGVCFCRPDAEVTCAPSLWCRAERRAAVEAKRKQNAIDHGVKLIPLRAPSKEAIEKWEKVVAARKSERDAKGGGKAKQGTPAAAGVDPESELGAWYANLRELGDGSVAGSLAELQLVALSQSSETPLHDDDEDGSADESDADCLPPMCWYVLPSLGSAMPTLEACCDLRPPEFDAETHGRPVAYGSDEAAARSELARQVAACAASDAASSVGVPTAPAEQIGELGCNVGIAESTMPSDVAPAAVPPVDAPTGTALRVGSTGGARAEFYVLDDGVHYGTWGAPDDIAGMAELLRAARTHSYPDARMRYPTLGEARDACAARDPPAPMVFRGPRLIACDQSVMIGDDLTMWCSPSARMLGLEGGLTMPVPTGSLPGALLPSPGPSLPPLAPPPGMRRTSASIAGLADHIPSTPLGSLGLGTMDTGAYETISSRHAGPATALPNPAGTLCNFDAAVALSQPTELQSSRPRRTANVPPSAQRDLSDAAPHPRSACKASPPAAPVFTSPQPSVSAEVLRDRDARQAARDAQAAHAQQTAAHAAAQEALAASVAAHEAERMQWERQLAEQREEAEAAATAAAMRERDAHRMSRSRTTTFTAMAVVMCAAAASLAAVAMHAACGATPDQTAAVAALGTRVLCVHAGYDTRAAWRLAAIAGLVCYLVGRAARDGSTLLRAQRGAAVVARFALDHQTHLALLALIVLIAPLVASGQAPPSTEHEPLASIRVIGPADAMQQQMLNVSGRWAPPSPPPSPPDESDTAYGLRAPKSDYLTREQADALHLELLGGNEVPPELPASVSRALVIVDTGCGRTMGNHREQFDGLYDCEAAVEGAAGSFKTTQRGRINIPMATESHGTRLWQENKSILNEMCAYILLALGRASIERGVSLHMPQWGADGSFTFPSGVAVKFYNRYVLVLRPVGYKESPPPVLAAVTVDSLGVPADGLYVLYIGSGKTDLLKTESASLFREPVIVNIDAVVGGTDHNYTRRPVVNALVTAAADERCAGAVVSIRCSTWSAVHFLPDADGNPGRPPRDCDNVLGRPRADGTLSRAVIDSNLEAEAAVEIAHALHRHGAFVLAETPVKRAAGYTLLPKHVMAGCEKHVYNFDHPAWVGFRRTAHAQIMCSDQCMDSDDPELSPMKSTAWLATGSMIEPARAVLSVKQCDHPPGSHVALRGAGPSGQYVTSKSETYSRGTNRSIARCIDLATTRQRLDSLLSAIDGGCFVAGVIRGKRLAKEHVTHELLHRITNHAEARVVRLLPECWSDADESWTRIVRDEPCDACLRGEAPRMGPSGPLPTTRGLIFLDTYHCNISTLYAGERNVIGITTAHEGFFKTVRTKAKSDASKAIAVIEGFLNSLNWPIAWIHTDGAGDLSKGGVLQRAREKGWRITTTVADRSRANRQEPNWRVASSKVRKDMCQSKLPYECWGECYDNVEEGIALTPSRTPPHTCSLGRMLGTKPKGAHRRPFGCLAVFTDAARWPNGTLRNKVAEQGVYGICFGYEGGASGSFERLDKRTQSGYRIWDVDNNNVRVTDDVSFLPNVFPGVQRTKSGGWTIPRSKIPFTSEGKDAEEESSSTSDGDAWRDVKDDDAERDDSTIEFLRGFAPEPEESGRGGAGAGQTPAEPTDTEPPVDAEATPAEPAPPRASPSPRYLIPREHWPDDPCDEHDGRGWEVEIVQTRASGWSECRFITATDRGTRIANVWRRHADLLPLESDAPAPQPQPRPRTPPHQPRDNDEGYSPFAPSLPPAEPSAEPQPTPLNYDAVPNANTMPAEGHTDPLREPSRPQRATQQPDRYGFAAAEASPRVRALAARQAEVAGVGLGYGELALSTAALRDMPVDSYFVCTDSAGEQLAQRARDVFGDLSEIGMCAQDRPVGETRLEVVAAFQALEPEAQRVIALGLDHDELSMAYGAHSPQAELSRQLYAAGQLAAANRGIHVPCLEPLFTSLHPDATERLVPATSIFADEYDGHLMVSARDDIGPELVYLSKVKTAPDIKTERQMRGPEWDEPKSLEVASVKHLARVTELPEDDPSIAHLKPVNTMWTGRDKRDAEGNLTKRKARAVLRGDEHAKYYDCDANSATSPVVRDSSALGIDAVCCLLGQHFRSYDVPGAYLQAKSRPSEQVVARPPPGFESCDERGVRMVWVVGGTLYGQTDAGAIWNRTANDTITDDTNGDGLPRCHYDPCVYSVETSGGGRVTSPLYVDDARVYYDEKGRSHADKHIGKLGREFGVVPGPEDPADDYFLGANRLRDGQGNVSVRGTSYIHKLVERFADGDVSPSKRFPAAWSYTPADEELVRAFEEASATRTPPAAEFTRKYQTLFGALLHAAKTRPEIRASMGLAGACLTFATDRLYECLMRILVYLGRTADLGVTFTKAGDNARKLVAYADANWTTTRSTTGYCIMLGNACIAPASRRQHCIAMSTCEAELIALADLAIELIHVRGVLEFIGLEVEGPVTVWTDNKAAYDLCHRFTSAQNSRHVDRKLFKMRELRGLGAVDVRHVRTEDNPADIFTKILSRQVFEKHRATILNLDARHAFDRSRQLAAATSASAAPRTSRFRVSKSHG